MLCSDFTIQIQVQLVDKQSGASKRSNTKLCSAAFRLSKFWEDRPFWAASDDLASIKHYWGCPALQTIWKAAGQSLARAKCNSSHV